MGNNEWYWGLQEVIMKKTTNLNNESEDPITHFRGQTEILVLSFSVESTPVSHTQ